jgi:hypothetical protein
VLVRGEDGLKVLDLATGRARTPATSDVFLCSGGDDSYRGRVPYKVPGKTIHRRVFSGVFTLCDASGESSQRVPDPEVLEVEGAHEGDSWILSTPHAIVGYRAAG